MPSWYVQFGMTENQAAIGLVTGFILVGAFILLTRMGFPATGSATGYIYYQEKSGIFQQDMVCWKDTPYIKECEIFNPNGIKHVPGNYQIDYECGMFAWAWEKPSLCTITNAVKLS